eukprot:2170234-Lingulodinium_polyedra.AAC.1
MVPYEPGEVGLDHVQPRARDPGFGQDEGDQLWAAVGGDPPKVGQPLEPDPFLARAHARLREHARHRWLL